MISACVVFFGWNSGASRSTRSSGTFATPTFVSASAPAKPPVAACAPVSRLKSVVFPTYGRPVIAEVRPKG